MILLMDYMNTDPMIKPSADQLMVRTQNILKQHVAIKLNLAVFASALACIVLNSNVLPCLGGFCEEYSCRF